MQNITDKLNCKAELWGMVEFENELLETDTREEQIKQLIYCNIAPVTSMKTKVFMGVTEGTQFTHKFKVRAKSIQNIKVDMFFLFKGQKHQFKNWNIDYKNNEFLEVFTELILE